MGAGYLPFPPLAAQGSPLQLTQGSPAGMGEACPIPTPHLACSPGAAGSLQQDGTHHWILLHTVSALLGLPGECSGRQPGMHSTCSPDLQRWQGPWVYGLASRPSPSPTLCSWPLLSLSRASAHPGDDKPSHRALRGRGLADSIQRPILEGLGGGKGHCGSLSRQERGSV